MSDNNNNSLASALVAIVAIIAIAGVAYYVVQGLQTETNPVIDVQIPSQNSN